jgi:hypothetical protein
MGFIYGQESLRDAIARAVLEYEELNRIGDIHYMEIHRRVERITSHSVTHYQLRKTLSDMTHEREVIKNDPTQGKRGFKVYYALTNTAKKKYRLRILGPNEKTRRRKILYQLLIYFEVYKRRQLLTKIQLSRFLRQIGSSMKDLKKERDIREFDIPRILFKPIKGVDIIGFTQYDKRTKLDRMFYYTVLPGFSLEEFISYLKLLKNKTEPHPFSANITPIPYVHHIHFSKEEITESISSLHKDGLIKTTNPIIQGEKRFVMTDERFRSLSYYIWTIQIIDLNLLIGRLILKKPTVKEREYLSLYLRGRSADMVLAHAYDIRRQSKKEKYNDDRDRETIERLERDREFLVKELMKRYESIIKENDVVHEIMEGVCYFPLLSRKE